MYPSEYKYTKEHEWVSLKGDTATVGITDYAQHELGDVVYVDLPKVGASVSVGGTLGEVESTKSVSEIYAPVSGTVSAVNTDLDASFRYAEASAADWDHARACRFSIRERAGRRFVGIVGLEALAHLHQSTEIGYWLRRTV